MKDVNFRFIRCLNFGGFDSDKTTNCGIQTTAVNVSTFMWRFDAQFTPAEMGYCTSWRESALPALVKVGD